MVPLPVTLDVPDEIYRGILNGIYTIDGGTVRNSVGRIVKLLKDAPSVEKAEEAGLAKALSFAKNHKVATAAIVGGAVILLTGIGTAIWVNNKEKENASGETSEVVLRFDKAIKAYLQAAHDGTLDTETIQTLLKAIDDIQEASREKNVVISFTGDEFHTLMAAIIPYTQKLAEYKKAEYKTLKPSGDNILDLRRYLEKQKELLAIA